MKPKNLNNAIHKACKQSEKGCCRIYVIERDGQYIVCTEDELFDEYDHDQVIGCAFNGRWE
jgi:anti-sigma regulatory factor (Ser/Thr protein kinase)